MNAGTKVAALNKFRGGSTMIRQPTTKVLVVFDVQVKSPDVFQVPLVINYGRYSLFLSYCTADTVFRSSEDCGGLC